MQHQPEEPPASRPTPREREASCIKSTMSTGTQPVSHRLLNRLTGPLDKVIALFVFFIHFIACYNGYSWFLLVILVIGGGHCWIKWLLLDIACYTGYWCFSFCNVVLLWQACMVSMQHRRLRRSGCPRAQRRRICICEWLKIELKSFIFDIRCWMIIRNIHFAIFLCLAYWRAFAMWSMSAQGCRNVLFGAQ